MHKIRGLLVFSLMAATHSIADENAACLLEGSFSLGSINIEIKDCMENHGVAEESFQSLCSQIANTGAQLGAPPSITYMSSCPSEPQSVCKGFFGQPVHSYYYKRDVSTLGDVKTGCTLQGGEWENGTETVD